MNAMCNGERFLVVLLLLIWISTCMSSVPRGLYLFIYSCIFVGATGLTSGSEKRRKGTIRVSSLCDDASFR